MARITFQAIGVQNVFRDRARLRRWIQSVVASHDRKVGDLAFVLMSDEALLVYNKRFLSHHYYTDVITFDRSVENVVAGDILISLDRVRENARFFETGAAKELRRVMVHGVLHLLGYKDGSSSSKAQMRKLENEALALH